MLTDRMFSEGPLASEAIIDIRKAFTMSVQWLKTLKKLQHLPDPLPGTTWLKQSWSSVRILFRNRLMRTVSI